MPFPGAGLYPSSTTYPGADFSSPEALGINVELLLSGLWVNVSYDVRYQDGVSIARGRSSQGDQIQPATCGLTFDNRSGNYSPRNPQGYYYGQLGRNTPIRVSLTMVVDSFQRTVVNGWGLTTNGLTWTNSGGAATDYSVVPGTAIHSLPTVSSNRLSYLAAVPYRDIDIAVSVTMPFTNVLGARIELANIMLRRQSATDYYLVRVAVQTDETITVTVLHVDGTIIAAQVTVPGLTHSSTQTLRVRAQTEGYAIRVKVWAEHSGEPFNWTVVTHSERILSAGQVGVRSGVASGNTNTLPIVFSYSNCVVRSPRFTGEVASWPQKWHITENDAYAPIEAGGLLRRLSQGTSPQRSTLYRGITLMPQVVAYWPAEDGPSSTEIRSALGGPSMRVTGPTKFSTYDIYPSSSPIPELGAANWLGTVPPYASTGRAQMRYLMHIPATTVADKAVISTLLVSGTATQWQLRYRTGGGLELVAMDHSGTIIMSTGLVSFNVDDKNLLVAVKIAEAGANIGWKMETLELGVNTGGFFASTLVGYSVGRATRAYISPYAEMTSVNIGHILVRNDDVSVFDQFDILTAYAGETASDRIVRLGADNKIGLTRRGSDSIITAAVGTQKPETIMTLLNEAVDADLGSLFESRGDSTLTYRVHASSYNQAPVVELDYGGHQIAPPFEPVDDDRFTRNSITVTRTDGGTVTASLDVGRLSTLDPQVGGVGRYDDSVTVNVWKDDQLTDIATWRLRLGTVDETRYPSVCVNLMSPEVAGNPALVAQLLSLDIDDRFTIANPKRGQTPDTITQLARGYSEYITGFEHLITINASPESPYQVLQLDADSSHLDTTGSVLATSIDASVTVFSVATSSGARWTTAPGDMPIEITMDGETMSVTNIAGSGATQTFTVTRSTNGVIKPHIVGALVSIFWSTALGL